MVSSQTAVSVLFFSSWAAWSDSTYSRISSINKVTSSMGDSAAMFIYKADNIVDPNLSLSISARTALVS